MYALHYVEFQKNGQVFILSLADRYLNVCHCIELTFLEGKLGRCLILTFLKLSILKTFCILKVKVH